MRLIEVNVRETDKSSDFPCWVSAFDLKGKGGPFNRPPYNLLLSYITYV